MNFREPLYPKALYRLLEEPAINRPGQLLGDMASKIEPLETVHETDEKLMRKTSPSKDIADHE